MYLPAAFAPPGEGPLLDLIDEVGLGSVILAGDPPHVQHVPFLLDREARVLRGHVARANPLWRRLEGADVLVVFQGPHGYISPRWYASRGEVPTWNYAVAHAHGRARLLEREGLERLLVGLAERFEAGSPDPWRAEEVPAADWEAMVRAIVGFEVALTRIEGKLKLSQNRLPEDQRGAVAGLEAAGRSPDLVRWMRRITLS